MKYISIATRKYPEAVAQVDDDDYDRLSQFKWYISHQAQTAYAKRSIGKTNVYMHREILGLRERVPRVDHRDGNGLNNTKENLRECTVQQNQANRRKMSGHLSQYKGVTFNKRAGKWKAQLMFKKHNVNIGEFSDEVAAARAYDFFAQEAFGDFARLNFPA